MTLAFYNKLPIELLKHIYSYSREKVVSDYDYLHHRQASQLFYYHNDGNGLNGLNGLNGDQNASHSFWTYDIWVQPSHPEIKAVELTTHYNIDGKPCVKHISLANKECFQISKYEVENGWGLALHPDHIAFSIKLVKEMDIWERERWDRMLTRLYAMAYLDYRLEYRRDHGLMD